MIFAFICTNLISIVFSYNLTIGINARIFDPAGRDTSFLYDGGSIEINCWYIDENETETLQLQEQGGIHTRTLASVNGSTLKYSIFINSSSMSKGYRCIGEGRSLGIHIHYVLCNPMLVKPRNVCLTIGEFCHMKTEVSMECKPLDERHCLLGYKKPKTSTEYLHVLPKFSAVCSNGTITDKYGLCNSWSHPPIQYVGFVTNRDERCNLDFQLYICGKDCQVKSKLIHMAEWNFIDVAKTFSMVVQMSEQRFTVSCDIGYIKNEKIMSKKVTFTAGNRESYNADVITEQLKQLPMPTIADIVCVVTKKDETLMQYRTSLLVFNSDRDLKHSGSKETGGLQGDRFVVNVSSADGLYVCVEKGKEKCTPTMPTRYPNTAQAVAQYRQEENNHVIHFYVGLFASSPKQAPVVIHEKILHFTIGQPVTTDRATDIGSASELMSTRYTSLQPDTTYNTSYGGIDLRDKKKSSGRGWMIGFIIGLVVGILTVSVAIIIAIVLAIKKAKSHWQGEAARKGTSAPTMVPGVQSKKLKTTLLPKMVLSTLSPRSVNTTTPTASSSKAMETTTALSPKDNMSTTGKDEKTAHDCMNRTGLYSDYEPIYSKH